MIAPLRSPTRCASALVALLFAFPAAARAQAPASSATASELSRHPLFAHLTLSPGQDAALAAIRARYRILARTVSEDSLRVAHAAHAAAQTARDAAGIAKASARAARHRDRLAALLAAERSEFRAVLTPAQQAVFDANLAVELAPPPGPATP